MIKQANKYKRKLKTWINSVKIFLRCHTRKILYIIVLIGGVFFITVSFRAEGNLASVFSGVGTGLLTSLVVSVIINAENDSREKRKRNEDKHFVLNDIVNSSIDVYEDMIFRVNEFIMFSKVTFTPPIYKLYDSFFDYNAFEKELKQIDYKDAPDELKNQLKRLFNYENYRIDYLVAELKRLPKQEYYLKGLLNKDEYEKLTSNFANDTYLDYAGQLSEFWDGEIKDINKCIVFMRMTLYIASNVIDSLSYSRKIAVEKEASIQERLLERYYQEVYCWSDEYFQQQMERAEAEREYYEEHPEQDPNMTEEQLQRINQRKQMRTINAHQLAEILEKQGNSVEFISIPNKNHGGSIPDAIKHSLEQVQQ